MRCTFWWRKRITTSRGCIIYAETTAARSRCCDEARETCRSSGDQYHVGLCGLDLSEVYLELNLSQEAEETARQASVDVPTSGDAIRERKGAR